MQKISRFPCLKNTNPGPGESVIDWRVELFELKSLPSAIFWNVPFLVFPVYFCVENTQNEQVSFGHIVSHLDWGMNGKSIWWKSRGKFSEFLKISSVDWFRCVDRTNLKKDLFLRLTKKVYRMWLEGCTNHLLWSCKWKETNMWCMQTKSCEHELKKSYVLKTIISSLSLDWSNGVLM